MAASRAEILGGVTLTLGLWTYFVPNLHTVRTSNEAVAIRRSELLAAGTLVVFLVYVGKMGGDRTLLYVGLASVAGLAAMTEWGIRQEF